MKSTTLALSSDKPKSAFERYYDLFRLDARQIWIITLLDGRKRIGTLNASSMVNIIDPIFMFHDGSRNLSVPFSKLENAQTIYIYCEDNKSDELSLLLNMKNANAGYDKIHAVMRKINELFENA